MTAHFIVDQKEVVAALQAILEVSTTIVDATGVIVEASRRITDTIVVGEPGMCPLCEGVGVLDNSEES